MEQLNALKALKDESRMAGTGGWLMHLIGDRRLVSGPGELAAEIRLSDTPVDTAP
jgi:hypothetical protein